MKEHNSLTECRGITPKLAQSQIPRRAPLFVLGRVFLVYALLLGSSIVAQARDPDFSNYAKPLYVQVTDHIKEKVAARLGEGKNTRDRYFIIPFAYQRKGNDPEHSHSFLSVIHVFPDGKLLDRTKGLAERTYKNRKFEAFTISWLPHDFDTNPHLCVFEGFGARLVPQWNKCPVSIGKNFTLEATLKLAVQAEVALCVWGPYEITKGGFDLGVNRMRLLDGGTIKYRADDRLYRKEKIAINCFHAIAGLEELFPNGGIFGTGFMMWGFNGTARVLIEYKARGTKDGLLLEPVDEKKDRFGFVYAPSLDSQGLYNPFKTAFAYQR